MNENHDAILVPSKLAQALGSTAAIYRSNRKRSAIYTFLREIYGHYWTIKKSGKSGYYRAKLSLMLKPIAKDNRRLSKVLLLIASNEFDRREIHRWKNLLEGAYNQSISPDEFTTSIKSIGGINSALKSFPSAKSTSSKKHQKVISRMNPMQPISLPRVLNQETTNNDEPRPGSALRAKRALVQFRTTQTRILTSRNYK